MLWFNGNLCETAALDASAAGVTLGWGVFTTIGVRGGQPLFLERHLARLRRDAERAEVPLEWSNEQISAGLHAVLEANGIEDGHARLTLTRRGDGRWNNTAGADLSVIARPANFSSEPMLALLSEWRVAARSPLAGVKTTSYLPYLAAWNAARNAGFDEAILLDERGFLCEGARSSLFWIQNGALFTPALESGCLDGVGRQIVLDWARETGIRAHEGLWPLENLVEADAAILVSGAAGPRTLAALEGRHFATWERLAELQRIWNSFNRR